MRVFTPNRSVYRSTATLMVAAQLAVFAAVWCLSPSRFFPRPWQVASALGDLWQRGLALEILSSLALNAESMLIASVIALGLGILACIPFFTPMIVGIGKLRFLSLTGVTFYLTVATRNGHQLKLAMVSFAIVVFAVVGLLDILTAIPREKFDLARVLRMSPWRALYEVVILGEADKAIDTLRQNLAMGWLTIAFAEAMSREDGGVGAMLATEAKYFHLAAILALQIVILALGLAQDYAIGWLKRACCPYASLSTESRR